MRSATACVLLPLLLGTCAAALALTGQRVHQGPCGESTRGIAHSTKAKPLRAVVRVPAIRIRDGGSHSLTRRSDGGTHSLTNSGRHEAPQAAVFAARCVDWHSRRGRCAMAIDGDSSEIADDTPIDAALLTGLLGSEDEQRFESAAAYLDSQYEITVGNLRARNSQRLQSFVQKAVDEGMLTFSVQDALLPLISSAAGPQRARLLDSRSRMGHVTMAIEGSRSEESELERLTLAVEANERGIRDVTSRIEGCLLDIERAAENAEVALAADETKAFDYWSEKAKQLREREKQLREEMKQMRAEMKHMRAEIKLLLEQQRSAGAQPARTPLTTVQDLDDEAFLTLLQTLVQPLFGFNIAALSTEALFDWTLSPLIDRTAFRDFEMLHEWYAQPESARTVPPGRADVMETVLKWADSVYNGSASSRARVPVCSQAPGHGKTTFLVFATDALTKHIEETRGEQGAPIVSMFSYNAGMSAKLTDVWPSISSTQALALRILYGGVRCMGVDTDSWSTAVTRLARPRLRQEIGPYLNVDQALTLLRHWFGPHRDVLIVVDELLKGVEKCGEAATPDDLAHDICISMDSEQNQRGRAQNLVVLSALSTKDITFTKSNRRIQPLRITPLPVAEGMDFIRRWLPAPSNKASRAEHEFSLYLLLSLSGGVPRILLDSLKRVVSEADRLNRRLVRTTVDTAAGIELPGRDDRAIEYILANGPRVRKSIELLPEEVTENRVVADLVNDGSAFLLPASQSDDFGEDRVVIDMVPIALWSRVVGGDESPPVTPRLRLLYDATRGIERDAPVQEIAERIWIFATACALAEPRTGVRDAILPDVDAVLRRGTGLGWGQVRRGDLVQDQDLWTFAEGKARVRLELSAFQSNATSSEDDRWDAFWGHLLRTQPADRDATAWRARIVLAPPQCPAVDYVVHFYMSASNGDCLDVFYGCNAKSATASTSENVLSMLRDKVDKAGEYLSRVRLRGGVIPLHAVCYHVADVVDDEVGFDVLNGAGPTHVVFAPPFSRHFPLSLLRLMGPFPSTDDS